MYFSHSAYTESLNLHHRSCQTRFLELVGRSAIEKSGYFGIFPLLFNGVSFVHRQIFQIRRRGHDTTILLVFDRLLLVWHMGYGLTLSKSVVGILHSLDHILSPAILPPSLLGCDVVHSLLYWCCGRLLEIFVVWLRIGLYLTCDSKLLAL